MKTSELRDMTKEELNGKLEEERHALFNLRFQSAVGQVENRLKLRTTRRDIARILTVLREREIKENKHATG